MPLAVTDWGMATWTGLTAGLVTFYGHVPGMLGALAMLLVGWIAGSLLATLAHRVLEALRFDAYMARGGVDEAINRAGVRVDPAGLVAGLVKWAVRLVAVMLAADALHLPALAAGSAALLGYLPNLLAAAVILALGLTLAAFVGRLIRGSVHLRTRELLAGAASWGIGALAVLGALGQLAIAPALVQTLYTAGVGAVALAAALAFGLGLRDQARDVVAGHALAEQLHEGDEITLDQVRGRIARIGSLKTLIHTGDGFTSVPNHMLIDTVFRVHGPRIAPAGGGGGPTKAPSWRTRVEDDSPP
ncbi:MAG: small-conductance mechanosensitive ion channel-like protein [Cyanobacteria bacterium RYN_339]|nr:small-conductance mechanosensitive ion channel-like protein [Cyanobacteria bacterium RYN_339]